MSNRLTSGQPSFVVQEEFDRYTGYWWQPQPKGDVTMHSVYMYTPVAILYMYKPNFN